MAFHSAWSTATLLGLGLVSPAWAEDCRLALVLALDVSASVDAQEDRLQRDGLARALVAPEVVRAFLMAEPVALFVFEWSGPRLQEEIVPGWQVIRSERDLERVAALIVQSQRAHVDYPHHPSTALGAALGYAAAALRQAPDCQAHTVDLSGDGESSDGISPTLAYALFPHNEVTVNALVVGGEVSSRGEPVNAGDLMAYFRAKVLHGASAFCVLADGYEDYERAMRAKLLRELQMPMVSGLLVAEEGA
jgi:hypothetical protein